MDSLRSSLDLPTQGAKKVANPSRAEATMEAIERYIAEHRLQSGDPLPTESEFCTFLGVSRSSVREAIRQLQALEIVSVHQGRGAFVGEMSLRPFVKSVLLRCSVSPDSIEALRQVIVLRRVLDRGIAQDVVSVFANTHNDDLHDLVNLMEEKARRNESFLEEDIAFHSGLLRPLDNLLMGQLVGAMWRIHMEALPSLHQSPRDLLDTALAHRAMLLAIEAGGVNAYLEAVNAHYQPLEDLLSEI